MKAASLKARVLPSLLTGLRREPLRHEFFLAKRATIEEQPAALAALSLCGQALRFERPERPGEFNADEWPAEDRPIVPSEARALLRRLFQEKRITADSEFAVACALDRRRLRPHPFDLPRMESFLRKHAERLGAAAQYWVERETPEIQRRGYFDADELTPANWAEAPLARRAAFLEGWRARDAAGAREALASVWASRSADERLRLLGAMQASLSIDDMAFLEPLKKDRAPRVRALAARLLARLSDAPGENPALKECLSRIERTKAGLLRKRAALKLTLPANVKEPDAPRWIAEEFADVGLDELASALELETAALADAAEKDANLLLALAMMASAECRWTLLEKIVTGALPEAWGKMSECGWSGLDPLSPAQRMEWAAVAVRPQEWIPPAGVAPWSWLLRQVEGLLPVAVMDRILKTKSFSEQIAGEKPPSTEWVQAICALCPGAMRERLSSQLGTLERESAGEGLLLLETLDRLEKTQ
jgi:hypothetical protein